MRREFIEPGSDNIECQQHAQEPLWPSGPEWQLPPMLPVGSWARIDCREPIDRIESDRHQQIHHQDQWQADPQEAIVQELDKASYYIERNANAKILFHALTIKLYHIIQDKIVFLAT